MPRPDVTAVVLDGEAVLLAEGASEAHYLDEIATLVWSTFDGSATLDELAADFAEVFNADIDVVRGDIVALTQGIGRAGLLVGVAYEAPPDPSFAFPTGVAIGEPIPPFRLPDADGAEVALADLAERQVLLVNWSPRCGFCTRIAPELAELQPELQARGVEMVFITLGDAEENRPLLEEHGLHPRVLVRRGLGRGGVRGRRHAVRVSRGRRGKGRVRAHDRRGQGPRPGAIGRRSVVRTMHEEPEHAAWAYRSPCYRALNLTFGVRSTELDVGAYLEHVLIGLGSGEENPGDPEIWYSIVRSGSDPERDYSLLFGSSSVVRAHSKAFAIETLLWHLNGATVKRAAPFVVLHAGGVTLDGTGAIISGPSGSGKTTLTATLVRAGFGYLTDEALAIDPVTGLLHPYPKALAIKKGSWELLADLRPPPLSFPETSGTWPPRISDPIPSPGRRFRQIVSFWPRWERTKQAA